MRTSSEKQILFIINYFLYLSALINNNKEIANKAFDKIVNLNTDFEVTKMTKIEAHITLLYLKLFYKIFKIKKTSSLINFIIKLLKNTYIEEINQKNNISDEICLLLNKSPISILLDEVFEKNSFIVVQILEKLNK
jgi:hypothetical protein